MEETKMGGTGKFPKGKLSADDEGELQFRMAVDPIKNRVLLDFGTTVSWLGLDKTACLRIAAALQKFGEQLKEE